MGYPSARAHAVAQEIGTYPFLSPRNQSYYPTDTVSAEITLEKNLLAFCRGDKIMSPKNHRTKSSEDLEAGSERATPILHQKAREIQAYGKLTRMPIALDENVREESVTNLNQLLADTMTLRDMYKKHHWQVAGHTFYQLHLLFDKHHAEQDELVDTIAERIQLLGGISLAMAHDVAETTMIPRPPRGREEAPVQISRLLEAHELILKEARTMA